MGQITTDGLGHPQPVLAVFTIKVNVSLPQLPHSSQKIKEKKEKCGNFCVLCF